MWTSEPSGAYLATKASKQGGKSSQMALRSSNPSSAPAGARSRDIVRPATYTLPAGSESIALISSSTPPPR